MTSGGKLRGIDPAPSHSALSLVHVHDRGQRGCLALLLSTKTNTDAATSTPSHCDRLAAIPILATCASSSPAHEPGSPLRCCGCCCCCCFLEAERRAVSPGDHTPVCVLYDDEENKSDVCCGVRGCQLAVEQRRCAGRWGSQREQTEHLHLKKIIKNQNHAYGFSTRSVSVSRRIPPLWMRGFCNVW